MPYEACIPNGLTVIGRVLPPPDRFQGGDNCYSRDRLRGCRIERNWNNIAKVAMGGGAAAAMAGLIVAGPIAVGIVGTHGLTGAAAMFKALAALGGGAIKAGGAGMFGGKMLIVSVAAAAGVSVGAVYGLLTEVTVVCS
jgi:hypothetical protein